MKKEKKVLLWYLEAKGANQVELSCCSSREEGFGKPNPPKPGPVCGPMILRVLTISLFCNCRDLLNKTFRKLIAVFQEYRHMEWHALNSRHSHLIPNIHL